MVEEIVSTLQDDAIQCPEEVDPSSWEAAKQSWKNWKEAGPNTFTYQVMNGMEGKNIGLSNGLQSVSRYIHGTHSRRYYLLAADSGVGKTTVGDFMYVIRAWISAKKEGRKIKIFYFSFEIAKVEKEARWACYFLYKMFGLSVPADYLLSRISGKLLSKEDLPKVMKAYAMVQEMLKDVEIIETPMAPGNIFGILINFYAKHGKIKYTTLTEDEIREGKKPLITGYVADDPDLYVEAVIDHLALVNKAHGMGTKDSMDLLSRYLVLFRNMFYLTPVVYQQFSTDLMSYHRTGKKSEAMLTPQRLDFGDSKSPFRDADVVMGLVKPVQFDYSSFYSYILMSKDGDEQLLDYFTAMYLMKNRYGPAGKMLPLFMDKVTGMIHDLPNSNNPFAMKPWYDKVKQIEQICLEYSPKES